MTAKLLEPIPPGEILSEDFMNDLRIAKRTIWPVINHQVRARAA